MTEKRKTQVIRRNFHPPKFFRHQTSVSAAFAVQIHFACGAILLTTLFHRPSLPSFVATSKAGGQISCMVESMSAQSQVESVTKPLLNSASIPPLALFFLSTFIMTNCVFIGRVKGFAFFQLLNCDTRTAFPGSAVKEPLWSTTT